MWHNIHIVMNDTFLTQRRVALNLDNAMLSCYYDNLCTYQSNNDILLTFDSHESLHYVFRYTNIQCLIVQSTLHMLGTY
jgi:hypothetical protein